MSEWKTLDDLITEWCKEASLGDGLLEAPVFWGLAEKHAKHYHIIPGADVVVTAKGLEDAGKALFADERWGDWDGLLPGAKANYIRKARAALEAAGIIIPDEVVEVGEMTCVKARDVLDDTLALPGDTIFIKRATTGKEE